MRSQLYGAGTQLFPFELPGGSRRLTPRRDFASQQYTGRCVRKLCLLRALRTFVVALLTVSALLPAAAQVKPVRRVLVFNDFGSVSSPGIAEMDREIFDGLQNSSYMVEFYNENLEVTLFPDEASQRQVRDWYVRKYSDRKPDVIITVGPASLRFMQEMHEGPFKDTPVVFCGIMEIPPGLEADLRFTGAWSDVQTEKTIESALRLQPGTRHVVVVGGVGSLDRQAEAIVREDLRAYESKFDFTYLTDLSMPSLLEQLKLLPNNTIVLHTAITLDTAGNRFIDATQAVPMVAGASRAPVFVLDDVDSRNGAVGGDVLSWAAMARDAAKSALRILNGEKPQDIPIVRTDNVYMFDQRALRRWGLKQTNLPPGSIVLNRQPSLWVSVRWYVIGGVTLILVEAVLISGLLWQRTRRKAAETRLIIANKQLAEDITVRKRTEAILRESEERFRLVANSAPVMIWMSGQDKLCTYFNQSWLEFTGRSLSQELGNGWAEGVHPEDLATCLQTYEQAFNRREPFQMRYRLRRHDGEYRWVFDQGVPRFDADGSFAGYIGSCIDITERKWAEEALREKEKELSEAQRIAKVGSWHWDAQSDVVTWSEELNRIFGRDPTLPGPDYKEHPSLYSAESWKRLSDAVDEALRDGTPYELDLELVRPDGTTRWVTCRGEALADATGRIVGLRGTGQDITERKLAEETLAGMSRKLIEAQEQERARIGRELHDDINQRLALLSVEIQRMREVSPVTYGELRSGMDELGKRTTEISTAVQSLSHELHSSRLEYLGLVSAMRGLCREFSEKHKVEIDFSSEGVPPDVPPDISLSLFRVTQEGLQNALKHSGVRFFEVKLHGSPTEIQLIVRDSGAGFDPKLKRDTQGLGLISMQERIRLVKGTFLITSKPRSGTEINVRVPLSAGAQTERTKLAGA